MKRLIGFLLFVLTVPFTVFSQVTVYTGCQYTGQSARLYPGNYYSTSQFNMPDRSISSVRVPAGYRVEFYGSQNLSGNKSVTSSSIACMSQMWDNKTRSIRITYDYDKPGNDFNPNGGVSIYTNCDYRGRYAYLPPGDYPRLRDVLGNDVLSSLRVPSGMVIEIFKDENFRGASTGKITADNRCLGEYWIRNASSVKVSYSTGGWIPAPVPPPVNPNPPTNPPPPTDPGIVTIYSSCGYFGKYYKFRTGSFGNLKAAVGNNKTSSFRIPYGLTVELYSENDFRGYLLTRYNSNQNCTPTNVQNARSMRVYRTGDGPSISSTEVVSYEGCSYTGKYSNIRVGSYSDLRSRGLVIPAALKVTNGYSIELFSQPNFKGTSTGKIKADIGCLGSWIKGKAMSAIVRRESQNITPAQNQ